MKLLLLFTIIKQFSSHTILHTALDCQNNFCKIRNMCTYTHSGRDFNRD